MDVRMLVVLLAAGVCCISVEAIGRQLLEDKLKNDLMYEYDPDSIPMADPTNGAPVNVSFGVSVIGIADFANNILTLDVWLTFAWSDFRLKWDSSKWKGLNKIFIPANKLWVPDVVLINSAMDGWYDDKRSFKASVESDGSIDYVPAKQLKAYCQGTEEMFKGNGGHYICGLKFSSWVYSGLQVDLLTSYGEVSFSDFHPSNHWEITNTSMRRGESYYSCCPDVPYIDIGVSLIFREKLSYHP